MIWSALPLLTVVSAAPTGGIEGLLLLDDAAAQKGIEVLLRGAVPAPQGPVFTPRRVLTNAEGRFSFLEVPVGDYRVAVRQEGRPPDAPEVEDEVSVTRDTFTQISLNLVRRGVFEGIVVDQFGRPLAGLFVNANLPHEAIRKRELNRESLSGLPEASSRTQSNGRFRIVGLPDGEFEVSVYSNFPNSVARRTARTGQLDLRLELQMPHALRGRVVNEAGRPVDRFFVDDLPVTHANGEFELKQAPTLPFDVWAKDLGAVVIDPARALSDRFGDFDVGTVVLPEGRTITGRVVDAVTDAPIKGAIVQLPTAISRNTSKRQFMCGETVKAFMRRYVPPVQSAADGVFEYRHLSEAQTSLVVTSEGYLPETFDVGTAVVRLRRGGEVRGRIFDADGRPIPHASMELLAVDSRESFAQVGIPRTPPQWTSTTKGGTFAIRGLPAGRYRIFVTGVLEGRQLDSSLYSTTIDVADHGVSTFDAHPRKNGSRLKIQIDRRDSYGTVFLVQRAFTSPLGIDQLRGEAWEHRLVPAERSQSVWEFRAVPEGFWSLVSVMPEVGTNKISIMPISVGDQSEQTLDFRPVLIERVTSAETPDRRQ